MFIAIYGGSIEKAVPLPVLPILVTGEALPVVSPPADVVAIPLAPASSIFPAYNELLLAQCTSGATDFCEL